LMVLLIFSEPAYRYWFARQPHDYSQEKKELDSLVAMWKWEKQDSAVDIISENRLFAFDPNITSKEELVKLGFSNALAIRTINYRVKGGKFILKKDLMKIYEMDSVLYKKLFPFILLPEKVEKENVVTSFTHKENSTVTIFNLNTADTSQLIKIYGIGSKLSQRIVNYRDKLGGFVSADQLKEVYGLDSLVIGELSRKSYIEENFRPALMDINRATEKDLEGHPYIKYKLARAITAYRLQHGTYRTVDDLKKIAFMDDAKFQKIKPYLSANP
jgi:competence protein ComEA